MADELHMPMMTAPAGRPSYRIDSRARGLDAGTIRLLVFAGIALAVLLVAVGAWALAGRRSAGVPVIQADTRPLRVKPDNPGGMQVAGADEPEDGAPTLGPAPEAPAPLALRAQVQANRPQPVTAPAVPPATGLTAATPLPAMPAPGNPAPGSPAPVIAAAPPASVPNPPAARLPATRGAQVQLAALDSEEAAQTEWVRLQKKFPDLLGDRQPSIQRADKDGKPIWRVRTGGFADLAAATGFCGRLRAKGGGCSLGTF